MGGVRLQSGGLFVCWKEGEGITFVVLCRFGSEDERIWRPLKESSKEV